MTRKKKPVKKVAAGTKNNKSSHYHYYREYRIVYEENNPDDRYGHIEYVYEGTDFEEFMLHQEKPKYYDINIPIEFITDMLEKVNLAKNNKPLKISKFEGEILEKVSRAE